MNEFAKKLVQTEDDGDTVTHSCDSTTRTVVGTYIRSGIHVNNKEYLPFPTLPVSRETTDNTADLIVLTFDILSKASGIHPTELYNRIHLHMTDITAHNKGINEALATKMDCDTVAGQIFCHTHLALAFDRDMNDAVHKIEQSIGMKDIYHVSWLMST